MPDVPELVVEHICHVLDLIHRPGHIGKFVPGCALGYQIVDCIHDVFLLEIN